MSLHKCLRCLGECGDVALKFAIDFISAFKKINRTVLAAFVGARRHTSEIFRNRCFHRPDKGMNRTDNEDRRFLIPAGFPQYCASVFRRMRFKGPCRVGAKLRDRKSTRLNSSHTVISYAVFCLTKKKTDVNE